MKKEFSKNVKKGVDKNEKASIIISVQRQTGQTKAPKKKLKNF